MVIVAGPPGECETAELASRGLKLRGALPELQRHGHRPELVGGGRLIFLTPEADRARLEWALREFDLRAAAVQALDVASVPEAYRLAQTALKLLLAADGQAPILVSGGEAQMLGSLAGSLESTSGDEVLGSLGDEANRPLIETLTAYFDAGNAVAAAENLNVHPQTVRYRLRRVAELTGRDPASGWDRFVLELALRARALTQP